MTRHFSPNGDGRRDVSRIDVRVRKDDDVTIAIVDAADDEVKRLATAVPAVARQALPVTWDGTTEEGGLAPEGDYRVRVSLRRRGRACCARTQDRPRRSARSSCRPARARASGTAVPAAVRRPRAPTRSWPPCATSRATSA